MNTNAPTYYFYDNFKNREARHLLESYVNLINKTNISFLTYDEVAKYVDQLIRMKLENSLTPLEMDLFNRLLDCGAIRQSKYLNTVKVN
jgi:hypothetical protein